MPLYVRILIAMLLGTVFGLTLHQLGIVDRPLGEDVVVADVIRLPADLILRALRALATPLVLFAILNAFVTTEIGDAKAGDCSCCSSPTPWRRSSSA
jgi:Na+/H+-dicarboxylate symporter